MTTLTNTVNAGITNSSLSLTDSAKVTVESRTASSDEQTLLLTEKKDSMKKPDLKKQTLMLLADSDETTTEETTSYSDTDISDFELDDPGYTPFENTTAAAETEFLEKNGTTDKTVEQALGNESYYQDGSLKLQNFQSTTYGSTNSSQEYTEQKVADLVSGKNMVQTSVALSVAAGSGSNGGAGIIVVTTNNNFKTSLTGTDIVKAGTLAAQARNDIVSVAVTAGVAGGAGEFNLAGSVLVSNVTQNAVVEANDFTATLAGAASIAAKNSATTVNVTGDLGFSVGTFAGGASILVMNTDGTAAVYLGRTEDGTKEDGATLVTTAENAKLEIDAANDSSVWGVSIVGAGSSGVALTGSVAVNRVANRTLISGKNIALTGWGSAALSATDASSIWTLSGSVSISIGTAGVGGAVAYTSSGRKWDSGGNEVDFAGTIINVDGLTLSDVDEFSAAADATDKIHNLTLGAGGGGTAGLSGAVGTNEVKRTVSATLTGVSGTVSNGLSVTAVKNSVIGNLNIAGAAAGVAAGTIGLSVNRITGGTTAALAGAENKTLAADTLLVRARDASDIESIGIAAAGAGTGAGAGAAAINLITTNVTSQVSKLTATVASAALVESVRDSVIGTYDISGSGGSMGAGALSVTVTEVKGATLAEIQDSAITLGTGSSTLTATGGIEDDKITSTATDNFLEEDLGKQRSAGESVSGLRVNASSTQTYKTMVGLGSGSGFGSAVGGGNITYEGGSTTALMSGSAINAGTKNVAVTSGNYTNVNTMLVAGSVALIASAVVDVNVITTEHASQASVSGGSITTTGDVEIEAEGKEGFGNLTIQVGGAALGAGTIGVNVTRRLSGTLASVANGATISAGQFTQSSGYIGRTSQISVNVAASLVGSAIINVGVNYAGNETLSTFSGSTLTANEASISSKAENVYSTTNVDVSAALLGGINTSVQVNTVEGSATTAVDSSKLTTSGNLTLSSENDSSYTGNNTQVTIGIADIGVSVISNRFHGSSLTSVTNGSELTAGGTLAITTAQNRMTDFSSIGAAVGVASIAVNVISTVIGREDDPYGIETAKKDSMDTGENTLDQKLSTIDSTVSGYLSKYGSDSTLTSFASNSSKGTETASQFTADELTSLAGAVKKSAVSSDGGAGSGTRVVVSDSKLTGAAVNIRASEDTAEGAGFKPTLGVGSISLASVAGLTNSLSIRHAASVTMTNSTLNATGTGYAATIGALIGGTHVLDLEQAELSGLSISGAASSVKLSGGADVTITGLTATVGAGEGTLGITALDETNVTVKTQKWSLTVAALGAAVSEITDASHTRISMSGLNLTGSLIAAASRSQTLYAKAYNNGGAGISGVGAAAYVTDAKSSDGDNLLVTLADSTVTGSNVSLMAINQANLSAYASGKGGGGLWVGVAKSTVGSAGTVHATLTGNKLNASQVSVLAAAGLEGDATGSAMNLSAAVSAYDGGIANQTTNSATVRNTTSATTDVSGNTFLEPVTDADGNVTGTELSALASGYTIYNSEAIARTYVSVLAIGVNGANIEHGVTTTLNLSGVSGTTLAGLTAAAFSQANVALRANSAGFFQIIETAPGASITYTDTSNAFVNVKGEWAVSGDASIAALVEETLTLAAENFKIDAVGGSGSRITATMTGASKVSVADGTVISTTGDQYLLADTTISLSPYSDDTFTSGLMLKSYLFGLGGLTVNGITTTSNRSSAVEVGSAKLTSGASLVLDASSAYTYDVRGKGVDGGLVMTMVNVTGTHTINQDNLVTVKSGAELSATSTTGSVILAASDATDLHAENIAQQYGLSGGSTSLLTLSVNRRNAVSLEKGAKIDSYGTVGLYAGKNGEGTLSSLKVYAYAQAYCWSLVNSLGLELKDTFNLTDTVNVAGDVISSSDITVHAKTSVTDFEEVSKSYRWTSQNAGTVRIAGTAFGTTASGFTDDSRVTVTGLLQAGRTTSADLTISGFYVGSDVGSGYTYTDAYGNVLTPTGEISWSWGEGSTEGTVVQGTTSLTNEYWTRYEQLLTLIAETANGSTAQLAYQTELKLLEEQMVADGYASRDASGNLSRIEKSSTVQTIKVSDLNLAGGSVKISSDSVEGTGTITAKAADHLNITNTSNAVLEVSNLGIQSQGGSVTWNGTSVTSLGNFKGTVNSSPSDSAAKVTIRSVFAGGKTVYATAADGTRTTIPVTSGINITGTVYNNVGSLSVQSLGDIYIPTSVRVYASGSITLASETGSVTQSYVSGIYTVGQSKVEDLWAEETSSSTETKSGGGGVIAGGDVIISADMINVNGTIRSGFNSFVINIDPNNTEVTERIDAIKAAWQASGSPKSFNVYSDDYLVQSATYVEADGVLSWVPAIWYNPATSQLVIEDITPTAGHVYLTGRIANTGGGTIVASDGVADVTINVTGYNVSLGNITTGTKTGGSILITDTAYADSTRSAKVTQYMDGVTTTWDLVDGQRVNEATVEGYTAYQPLEGLAYWWSRTWGTVKTHVERTKRWFSLFGMYEGAWTIDSWWDNETTTRKESPATGATLGVLSGIDWGDNKFLVLGETETVDEGLTKTTDYSWTEYSQGIHFSGYDYYQKTTVTSTTTTATYAVKADNEITIGTSTANGKIDVKVTGGNLSLGGLLTTDGGEVYLNAIASSSSQRYVGITSGSETAGISGASNIVLSSSATKGYVGTGSNAIKLYGSSGVENLTLWVHAGNSVYVDATGLADGVTLDVTGAFYGSSWGSHSAMNTLSLKTNGDLKLTNAASTIFDLSSASGSVTATISQEGTTAWIRDKTNRKYVSVSAAGDIDLTSETDLSVGTITAGGDVNIVVSGSLVQAYTADKEDAINTDDRIESWKTAGIIIDGDTDGSQAAAAQKADVIGALEAAIRQEFARYEAYSELSAESYEALSDDVKAECETLKAKFSGYETADAYIAAQTATAGTKLYEAANAEYYGFSEYSLLYAISQSILDGAGGSTSSKADITGRTVTLAVQGSIGDSLDSVTYNTSELTYSTKEGRELFAKLARAGVGDLVWNDDGTFTLSLKRAVTVSTSQTEGYVDLTALGSIYLQSVKNELLTVKSANAGSKLRLIGDRGLYAYAPSVSTYSDAVYGTVIGNTVTLDGGTGGIGAEDAQILVTLRTSLLDQSTDTWLAATATGDIWVATADKSSTGTLTLYTVNSTSGSANIDAGQMSVVSRAANASTGEPAGEVKAAKGVSITAASIGTDDTSTVLRVGSTELAINGTATGSSGNTEALRNLRLQSTDSTATMTVDFGDEATEITNDVALTAAGGLALSGKMSAASTVKLSAVSGVTILDGAVIASSKDFTTTVSNGAYVMEGTGQLLSGGTFSVKAASADLGGESYLAASDGLTIRTTGDIATSGTSFIYSGGKIAMNAGGALTVSGGTLIFSGLENDTSVSLTAANDVTLSGSAVISGQKSASAEVASTSGNVTMKDGVRIAALVVDTVAGETTGDESPLAQVKLSEVTLSAAQGDVIQTNIVEDTGVSAARVNITANNVSLASTTRYNADGEAYGANYIEHINVDADGDIRIGVDDSKTTITVNAENSGNVFGDLVVNGVNSAISFVEADGTSDEELQVLGNVSLHGSTVTAGWLHAAGSVEISTGLYDKADTTSVALKRVDGESVTILTNKGSIATGNVVGTQWVDIYRTSTDSSKPGSITVGAVYSGGDAVLYNASGAITAAGVTADSTYVITSSKQTVSGIDTTAARTWVLTGSSALARYLDARVYAGLAADEISFGMLGHFSFQDVVDDPIEADVIEDIEEVIKPAATIPAAAEAQITVAPNPVAE